MAERTITIALMRAYFDEGFNNTVENVLISAFQKLKNASNRVVPIDLISSHLFAYLESCNETGGTFVRVLEFENGGIGVIDLNVLDGTQIVEEFVHPNKKDFLKRETVFLFVENDILACNIGNKSGAMADSILNFGVKAEVISKDLKMKISDVPDHTTIQDLFTTGVRSIDFDVTDFIQNLDVSPRGAVGKRLMQYVFGDVSGAKTHRKLSATTGRLQLRRGRLKKEEVKRDDWLTQVGEEILTAESSDGYTIILEDGRKISNKQLRKSKSVKLRRYANSYAYDHSKQALREFYNSELKSLV